jgi:hypothetical protein
VILSDQLEHGCERKNMYSRSKLLQRRSIADEIDPYSLSCSRRDARIFAPT